MMSFRRGTPTQNGFGRGTPTNDGFGRAIPNNDGFGRGTPNNDSVGRATPVNNGFGRGTPNNDGFGRDTSSNDGFDRNTPSTSGFGNDTTTTSGFGQGSFSKRPTKPQQPQKEKFQDQLRSSQPRPNNLRRPPAFTDNSTRSNVKAVNNAREAEITNERNKYIKDEDKDDVYGIKQADANAELPSIEHVE